MIYSTWFSLKSLTVGRKLLKLDLHQIVSRSLHVCTILWSWHAVMHFVSIVVPMDAIDRSRRQIPPKNRMTQKFISNSGERRYYIAMEKNCVLFANPDFNFLQEYIEFLRRVIASCVKIHVPAKRENCFFSFPCHRATQMYCYKLICLSQQFYYKLISFFSNFYYIDFWLFCKFLDCSQ